MLKNLHWLHYVVGIFLMAMTGSLAFMWFDTTPPMEFDASESRIIPEVATSGMNIRVDWKVKVHRFCPGTNIRELFEAASKARIVVYDPVETATDSSLQGNDDHLIRTFTLPLQIAKPGLVGYRAHLAYQCNWLQRFFPLKVTTPDLFFELRPDAPT